MRLMLVSGRTFPLDDATAVASCQEKARDALSQDLNLARVKALCEFLDLPQADEATLDVTDPLRFATVRVMGYLRQHHGRPEAAELCSFSPAAKDLDGLIEEEAHRRHSRG